MGLIYKTYQTVTKVVDAEAGIYEVMISTESVDRSDDIVRAAGGHFENYLRNPVVLLGHDYHDLPVAKTLQIEVVPGGVKATFQFPPIGTYDKADTTRKLWDAGFLNAASIGFDPIRSINLDASRPWGPQDYIEWELLEWSIVTVPANQDALRLALENIDQTLVKQGRTLSAANEKRLRNAADEINQVLTQIESASDESDKSTPDASTIKNDSPHDVIDANTASNLTKLVELLNKELQK